MGPKYYKKKSNVQYKSMNTDTNGATFLVIVESPSKCGKIESYLGPDYKCIASKGHIRELNGLKNIDIKNNFHPTFTNIKEKGTHIKEMREVIDKFSKKNIIIATDDDREGEGIAWHICEIFKLPVETTKRIIFHEITKPALTNAINNPTIINMRLVQAQQTRQILDVLVGFKISPHLWKHIYSSKEKPLSAGRCQTPALRLINDNENERLKNGAEKRYKTTGIFTQKDIEFVLGHEFEEETMVEEFLEKSKTHDHMLSIGNDKESIKSPPKPFNTSRLLQTASNALHTSPKQTMQICQTLYQNGLITYMRTESTKYAPPFLDSAKKYIEQTYDSKYVGHLSLIENKDKNNPHEAIRVTDINKHSIPSSKESAMYKLIWRNTLESCMADAKYMNTSLNITAPTVSILNKSKKLSYNHTLEMPIFLGWKKVTIKTLEQTDIMGLKMYLRTFLDRPIPYSKIESNVVIRNKISYYSESSLIKKLEEFGIGRPSTFAMIVDTIQERNYVKCVDIEGKKHNCKEFLLNWNKNVESKTIEKKFGNEKSKLQIQPLGVLCINFLETHFDSMFSYNYTKQMEEDLDNIVTTNDISWSDICNKCLEQIKTLSKQITKLEKDKYPLDDEHEIIFTQYGPSIKKTNEKGEITYLKTNTKEIDIDKLQNNQYTLEGLLLKEEDSLGIFDGNPIKIKTGKYGNYLENGKNTVSIKEWKKPLHELDYKTAIEFIENNNKKDTSILREISSDMTIRTGKYGPYIFYKTSSMKKPKFLPLKKCPHEYKTCNNSELLEWINKTYPEVK
jgi:DNA topoisomerase-1